MNQLKQYWEAVKPRDTDIHYLIERSLAGPPGDWWQIIKVDVNNFQTFLDKFLKIYWDEQAQHELRQKLEFGSHIRDRIGSRTEYAIRIYAEANELRPTMSYGEIIQKLARHYNEEIKYPIIGRGIIHIDELIELLENFDRIGPNNINREGERAVVERERKRLNETKYNHQISIPQGQQSWRTQAGGNFQDEIRHPHPQNTPTWQRNTQGNY